jgi:CHAT domain-containing protein/tetratricopeptide (TPR) repeat protein
MRMDAERAQMTVDTALKAAFICALSAFTYVLLCLAPTVASADATPTPTTASLRAQADALHQEAIALYNNKDLPGAVDKYGQAMIIYARIGDGAKEALLANDVGVIAAEAGLSTQALSFYQRALDIYRGLNDKADEAVVLSNMGLANAKLGDQEKAVSLYLQAASVRRAIGNPGGAGAYLSWAAEIRYNQGRYNDALDLYTQALSLQKEAADLKAQAQALWKLALLYGALGQNPAALERYQESLAIYRSLGDTANERTTLSLIATVYQGMGKPLQALDLFQQIRVLDQRLGDRTDEALTVYSIAIIYDYQGMRSRAIPIYQESIALYHTLGISTSEAFALVNLATAYSNIQEYDKALDALGQALTIRRALGDRPTEGALLSSIGYVHYLKGSYDTALVVYEQALAVDRQAGNKLDEGLALFSMAQTYYATGEYQKAIDAYLQALPLHRELNIPLRVWRTLNGICVAYTVMGDHATALDYCQQALQVQQESGETFYTWQVMANIGLLYSAMGDAGQARLYLQQAMDAYELARAALSGDEARTSLAGQFGDAYAGALILDMAAGRYADAFAVSERARARSFLDHMGSAQLDMRAQADATLLDHEQALRLEMQALERTLRTENSKAQSQRQADLPRLSSELTAKQREYGEVLAAIQRTNPEYAALVSISPLTVAEVQNLLDKETTLLSYLVTRDKTYAYIITHDALHAVELAVGADELYDTVVEYRNFASLDGMPPSGVKLYNWLIAPLRQYLKTPMLGIIPHYALNFIPFAALSDGKRYLGEQYTIFNLPNASSLKYIQQKRKQESGALLAMANSRAQGLPTLAYADAEVEAIARLYNVRPLLDSAATRTAFLARAPEAGIIHLAAHGQGSSIDPLASRIALAADDGSDGYLTLADVYELKLKNTDLVVLSACRSSVGQYASGDEIIGLARAFIYAGSPSVVASLWSVDDQATGLLMTSFYKHLKQGMGKAAALRAAQADTRAKYPHPYYWAAFVLTGDPGASQTGSPSPIVWAAIGLACVALAIVAASAAYRAYRPRAV